MKWISPGFQGGELGVRIAVLALVGVASATLPATARKPRGDHHRRRIGVAVAADGTAYVSDTFGGRILRLKPGSEALDVWAADPQLRGVDGLSLLADGALYANNFFNGKLSRIPVKEDGTAGPIVVLQTSVPFTRPDGLRTSGPKSLLQVEGRGRLTEITIEGDRGEVRIIKDGLTNAAGVTAVGATALVLVERRKAVAVPMTAAGTQAPVGTPPQESGAGLPRKP